MNKNTVRTMLRNNFGRNKPFTAKQRWTSYWQTNRVEQTAGRQVELNKLLADKQSWKNFWQTSRIEQTARRQLELKNLLAEEQS
jgi:hypothetical protein